ncbi:hypothetical protein AC578_10073 [Pseudocercospora eumusae]|uniref:Uncharacterized protein n=1 Tax=Pseudocercospora eumusae TaxID=321146 RepID=A0A139H8B9_9PEZI|nr:hypothetical protein AC578_10073 [Pseudocercospora eumusae]
MSSPTTIIQHDQLSRLTPFHDGGGKCFGHIEFAEADEDGSAPKTDRSIPKSFDDPQSSSKIRSQKKTQIIESSTTHFLPYSPSTRQIRSSKMCVLNRVTCPRCGAGGGMKTLCPANSSNSSTCPTYGVHVNDAFSNGSVTKHSLGMMGVADVSCARCASCGKRMYIWGVGQMMDQLGMQRRVRWRR